LACSTDAAEREPRFAWFDGQLIPFAEARLPIEDRGLQFGESLYEVVAISRGQARYLAEHAERMRSGATLLGIEAGCPDAGAWLRLFAELAREEQLDEGVLIAQLTGGTAARSHLPRGPRHPCFFAYLRTYRFPRAAETDHGIAAITHPELRWLRCDLKSTMLLPAVLAKQAAAERGAREAIFFGPDQLAREGASSNLFVSEGRRIFTPRQSEQLLAGITRPIVAALAEQAGYVVEADDLSLGRVRSADELFVTSTTFTVMPVVSLDGVAIGNGSAGPVALELGRQLRLELELDD
jgi:D-alanine transaminase